MTFKLRAAAAGVVLAVVALGVQQLGEASAEAHLTTGALSPTPLGGYPLVLKVVRVVEQHRDRGFDIVEYDDSIETSPGTNLRLPQADVFAGEQRRDCGGVDVRELKLLLPRDYIRLDSTSICYVSTTGTGFVERTWTRQTDPEPLECLVFFATSRGECPPDPLGEDGSRSGFSFVAMLQDDTTSSAVRIVEVDGQNYIWLDPTTYLRPTRESEDRP